jgi:hypothetical protein
MCAASPTGHDAHSEQERMNSLDDAAEAVARGVPGA